MNWNLYKEAICRLLMAFGSLDEVCLVGTKPEPRGALPPVKMTFIVDHELGGVGRIRIENPASAR